MRIQRGIFWTLRLKPWLIRLIVLVSWGKVWPYNTPMLIGLRYFGAKISHRPSINQNHGINICGENGKICSHIGEKNGMTKGVFASTPARKFFNLVVERIFTAESLLKWTPFELMSTIKSINRCPLLVQCPGTIILNPTAFNFKNQNP